MSRFERGIGSGIFAIATFALCSWLLSLILPYRSAAGGQAAWLLPLALALGAAWLAWSTPSGQAIPDHAEDLTTRSDIRRTALLIAVYVIAWSATYYLSHDEIEWLTREWNRFWIGLVIPPVLAILFIIWRRADDGR